MTEPAGNAPTHTTFDPVNTPIEQIDLTDPLIMHSAIRALQDEVLYWREAETCRLSTALIYAGEPDKLETWLWNQSPERALREHTSALADALKGDVLEHCVAEPGCILRPGDKVVSYADEGEAHALCAGASAEEMEAGRIAIPPESLHVDDMSEEEAAEARKDPHATIFTHARLFTPEQIAAHVSKGQSRLAAIETREQAREARIAAHFAASQDNGVGGRYGLTTSTDRTSVSACRAWFTDLADARAYAAGRDLTVWDLVEGVPVAEGEAA